MKNIFIGLCLLFLTLVSCSKDTDDSSDVCTGNCTTFRYKFITTDSIGIPNLNFKLVRYKPLGISTVNKRILASGTTNAEGVLEMNVYLKDDEIQTFPSKSTGSFDLLFSDDNPNKDKYLFGNDDATINQTSNIKKRDTVISKTLFFDTKAFITVNLNNFEPVVEKDQFSVYSNFGKKPYGSREQNKSFKIEVALKKTNRIEVTRIINGNYSGESRDIFVPENNNIVLDFDYKKLSQQ